MNAEWLEINGVLSEVVRVVEDAKQKSADLSFSIRTFRATSSMMEQIRQKLEELASIGDSTLPILRFYLFCIAFI